MENHIYLVRSYLPVDYEEEDTSEFIEYLVSAYLENLKTDKFQFAYTAFHMLYMSYIFKVNWFLKQQGNESVESSLNSLSQQFKYSFNTIFDLSQISEKTSLEKLLLSLNFHVNEIGICKNFVDVRNNCAHPSGKVYYKKASQVEHYILQAIDSISSIQKKIKPQIKLIFDDFIEFTYDKNWIETDIKDWIINNYISQREIEDILLLKPSFLRFNSDTKDIFLKKILYSALISEMINYLDNRDEYFIKSLSILMKGLPEQIDIKTNEDDDVKFKNTGEIIEEKILPILTHLTEEESTKAQKILKLDLV